MNWSDLKVVLAVARTGAFTEAGRTLAVDPTTVSRRIAALERSVGKPLFVRAAEGLVCTQVGEAFVLSASRVEMEMSRLENALNEPYFVGETVRITAVPVVINQLLTPALVDMPCPSLPRLEFTADSRNLSFHKREADIALRFGLVDRGPAVTRLIANVDYAAYMSKDALGNLPWITYDHQLGHLSHVQWSIAAAAAQGSARVSFNDVEGMLCAARAGIGKALLPCFVADRESNLTRVSEVVLSRELWLAIHQDQRSQAHIRVVTEWIMSVCAKELESFR
jgi:DNA-binding transcriptional LysR family regulator